MPCTSWVLSRLFCVQTPSSGGEKHETPERAVSLFTSKQIHTTSTAVEPLREKGRQDRRQMFENCTPSIRRVLRGTEKAPKKTFCPGCLSRQV